MSSIAINPPNLEPPYDPYDDVEVIKVEIKWNDDLFAREYIFDFGFEPVDRLTRLKNEFYKHVCNEITQKTIEYFRQEEMIDTAELLEAMERIRYIHSEDSGIKSIVNWLKNNENRWLTIEYMDFYDIPSENQKEIRSFIEEERAIQHHINRGGEL